MRTAKAAMAVPLLALGLAASSCRHEAEREVASRDEKSLALPVVEIGGQPIARREFVGYLRFNLPEGEESSPDDPAPGGPARMNDAAFLNESSTEDVATRDRTLSRLFDRFVAERIVVDRAIAQAGAPTDDEVAAFLGSLGVDTAKLSAADREATVRTAREALAVKRFVQSEILSGLQINEDEVPRYYEEHSGDFRAAPTYRIRWVHFNERADAEAAYKRLRARELTLEAISEEFQVAIEGGQSGDEGLWSTSELPDRFRAAITSTPSGSFSEPLDDPYGGLTIFEVIEVRFGRELSLEEARRIVEFRLREEKGRDLYETYTANLFREKQVTIHVENLGFKYIPRT